ncbi:LuxR C-terminal-related transcriptional regulator [Geodermatophilus sp. YIM 151500]|uniref:LuxR family transcriptional regulator n=1 Tax=Geodermatophilus sp. YIM 151500 TaxID=2984531 RepID=UPI0021E4AEBB|nr:LuxR family transcriptional regulator [Geodermatophilus sp. YIM 151500]MCV2491950.1 LuxR C-terminal-related transcriptional regulator [Geodermatophilus sp. YIM 151500]
MRLSSVAETPASRTRGGRVLLAVPRGAAADGPVIATKLFVPALGTRAIERPRLYSRLARALDARLTVVVAPAGWGKSTLVAQWLRDAGVPSGWVSLDAADDDVTRFWRYLLLAVQQADARIGSTALRQLDAAGTDVERDVLPVLVNELADAGGDLLLVLDDYHLVRSPPVHRSMAALLDHAPSALHLVVTSRTDPPLSLSRLRVAGHLVEVRAEQLRFTAEEAARLLHRAAVPELSAGEVARLVDRTEGWAAGLQLAALRLADRPDRQSRVDFIDRFTGADRHVVDYVGEEVLDSLPSPLRRFLLETSVLPRLCAPLADAVTGRDDAVRHLDDIQRAGLFLTPLDDEGTWFRYHQLFRDLLRYELDRAGLATPAALHRRAAEWFRDHGEVGEAIGHALASGDFRLAGELIGQGWRSQFNLGHLQTVQGWLDALPPAQVAADARLTVARVWLHMDRGRLAEAGAALAAAERAAADDAHVGVLRALHAFKTGDVPGAAEQLGAVPGRPADPFLVTVQHLVGGVCALWLGDLGRAAERLRRAAGQAEDTDNRLAQIYALGAQALVAVLAGDLRSAEAVLGQADAVVADALVDAHFVAMFPSLAAARLALQRGRWEDAVVHAGAAAELAGRGAGRVEQAAAFVTAAEAARRAGRDTGQDAARWLGAAAAVLRDCADPGPTVRDWVGREQRTQRAVRPAAGEVVERLTERELAILSLLPTTLSQREMAGSLFVSPNTMKTHLRAIYRKLGAESRDDAVLRARSLGLL